MLTYPTGRHNHSAALFQTGCLEDKIKANTERYLERVNPIGRLAKSLCPGGQSIPGPVGQSAREKKGRRHCPAVTPPLPLFPYMRNLLSLSGGAQQKLRTAIQVDVLR